jgi:hypothetical protein
MRINAQEEKRKHGITCHTSSPLETGVLQRDSRVWLHPKRRLACPLGRLPMKPNGARRRRRIDVPRRGTPSTQRPVCQLYKALLRIVNGSKAVGSLPHSYASKCAGRETKARYYMRYEQPLGEGARRRRRIDVPRRVTLLRSGQYANCAKRYSVSSSEAKPRALCLTRMRRNEQGEK